MADGDVFLFSHQAATRSALIFSLGGSASRSPGWKLTARRPVLAQSSHSVTRDVHFTAVIRETGMSGSGGSESSAKRDQSLSHRLSQSAQLDSRSCDDPLIKKQAQDPRDSRIAAVRIKTIAPSSSDKQGRESKAPSRFSSLRRSPLQANRHSRTPLSPEARGGVGRGLGVEGGRGARLIIRGRETI
jgi:hypothetical protein